MKIAIIGSPINTSVIEAIITCGEKLQGEDAKIVSIEELTKPTALPPLRLEFDIELFRCTTIPKDGRTRIYNRPYKYHK